MGSSCCLSVLLGACGFGFDDCVCLGMVVVAFAVVFVVFGVVTAGGVVVVGEDGV